ncbi:RHS repeat-associated core domain-containing protein [Streptomyces achromogenes]|uniref:RHS repeat-associated core domain-containing protein n=1 Tax=Streptomyces achromogenes TaxID=67255 RepID=UPI0036A88836
MSVLTLTLAATGMSPSWSADGASQISPERPVAARESADRKAPESPAAWSLARKKKQAEQLARSADDLSISPRSSKIPWVADTKTPGYKHLSTDELKFFKPRAATLSGKTRQSTQKAVSAADWPAGHPYIAHARSFSYESPTPSFTGAYYDTTTGYLDLHARQYDTTTGRFTSTDPLTPDQTVPAQSAYAYANNQPTYLTDPSGQCWWIPGSGDESCWTAKIPGTDLLPFASSINAFSDSVVDTCKSGASYATEQGRWAWTGCVDEFTGVNAFRKSADCISTGQYGQGTLWGLNGIGTAGLWLFGGPEGSTAKGLPGVAVHGDWPLSAGNLRFGPGGGGSISAYGGIPYKTPITPALKDAVNPFEGETNCRACAVATDHLLAGKGVSMAPKNLKAGDVAPIERLYGTRFKSASLASVVREVSKGGEGTRGIVWGSLPPRRDGRRYTHVFNVVNVGGDVIFLDAQRGHAEPDKIKVFGFLRTG